MDLNSLPEGAWYHKCKPKFGDGMWIHKEFIECPECGMNQNDESVRTKDDFVKGDFPNE